MTRDGEVKKRLVRNEESITGEVQLTFSFDSWDEAIDWMNKAERGLQILKVEEEAGRE